MMETRYQRIILLLTQLAINALALAVIDSMFNGVQFDTWQAVLSSAVLLALVNTYLRPLIMVMTLPLTVLTLGLFTVVINAGMIQLVNWLMPGFHIEGFWTAIGAAVVISIISFLLNLFIKPPQVRVSINRR